MMKRHFSLFSKTIDYGKKLKGFFPNGQSWFETLGFVFLICVMAFTGYAHARMQFQDRLEAIVEYLIINPHLTKSEKKERLLNLHEQLTQVGFKVAVFERPNAPMSKSVKNLVDKIYLEDTKRKKSFRGLSERAKSNDDDTWST